MDISVAYQGGGAKFVDLLAAANALSELENDDSSINFFRISGASAGSIAAALHAAEADFDNITKNYKVIRSIIDRNFNNKKMKFTRIARRFVFGNAIFDEDLLRNLIIEICKLGQVDALQPINKLVPNRELRILRSDIRTNEAIPAHEKSESPLVESLLDSCSIPFVFRVPKKGNARPYILDGGMFQNLPAKEALRDLQQDQLALGVSFAKKEPPDTLNFGLIKYGFSILDSLLDERVEQSVDDLGEANVIRLPNRFGTTDFQKAVGENFERDFAEIKSITNGRFLRWHRDTTAEATVDWFSGNVRERVSQFQKTEEGIIRFFEGNLTGFHADLIHHEVLCRSATSSAHSDIYNLHFILNGSENVGLQYFEFKFYDSDAGAMKRPRIVAYDTHDQELASLVLPLRGNDSDRVSRILMCLPKPLSEGDTIKITKTEESFLGMHQYHNLGYITETLALGQGKSADKLRISVRFPVGYEAAHVRDANPAVASEAKVLSEEDGEQLLTGEAKILRTEEFVTFVSDSICFAGESQRNFIQIIYDKGNTKNG